jgi:hypothetical protein
VQLFLLQADDGVTSLGKSLKKNKTLQTLTLMKNRFASAGIMSLAKALQANTSLTHFAIGDIEEFVDPAAVLAMATALTTNTSVTDFAFNQCDEINDAAAAAFADALKVNSAVTTIDFSFGDIRNKGAIKLADALKLNTTVTSVNLDGCLDLAERGRAALADAMSMNATVFKIDINIDDPEKEFDEVNHNNPLAMPVWCPAFRRLRAALARNNRFAKLHLYDARQTLEGGDSDGNGGVKAQRLARVEADVVWKYVFDEKDADGHVALGVDGLSAPMGLESLRAELAAVQARRRRHRETNDATGNATGVAKTKRRRTKR